MTDDGVLRRMMKGLGKNFLSKIGNYSRKNWGAPFIFGFVLLLTVTAGSLSSGEAVLASEIAIYAYCLLILGVVLQLACFLKYAKEKAEQNNGSG
jgi:heme/copper-type cytochrome/quinol oxidase subunit 4